MPVFKPMQLNPPFARTRWALFFVLYIIASYLSLTPQPGAIFENVWDKSLHLICWGGLAAALSLALLPRILPWQAFMLLFLSSTLIEAAQHWVPGRLFSLLDIGANGIGILLLYGCACLLLKAFTNFATTK